MSVMNRVIRCGTAAASSAGRGRSPANRSSGDVLFRQAGLALLWLAIGIGAGVAMLAALASLDAGEQLRVLAALAAGIGLIQLWLSLEASSPAGLWAGAISGSAMVLLALGAVPDRPALVGVAYLLGALAMLVRVQRAAPLLLSSGAGLAVLGLLGPGLGG